MALFWTVLQGKQVVRSNRLAQKTTNEGDLKTGSLREQPEVKLGKIIRLQTGQTMISGTNCFSEAWENRLPLVWFFIFIVSRIFCGDLGNDVTDELLTRTFNKFPSFQRAKVIRDKRTNKSKGYGFVSFKEPADFTKAMKEMNGKFQF